jgi:general stress protein 26
MANINTDPKDSAKAQQHFLEILRKFDQAMLVTQSTTGEFHARPMAIADFADDGSIWFISGEDTSKVTELKQDSKILAVMQSTAKYLSVSGRAEVQRDRAHVQRLWKDAYKAWFTGKDDPNIVLIQLRPSEAEYWDNSGIKGLKFALQYAAARVTGTEMRGEAQGVDQHAKVRM